MDTQSPYRRPGAVIGAAVLALSMLAGPGLAQDAAPAAGAPKDIDSMTAELLDWIKICNTDPKAKKEVCIVNQELRTDNGQFLASVAIREIQGEARKVLLIAVPPGMLIQPGLRVQVDNGKQEQAKYSICFPNACYAEMVLTDAMISSYKKGGEIILTTLNQQAKPVSFPISLKGFTKIYEGPALNPSEIEARQQRLEEELQKKVEQTRQDLMEAQKKAQESEGQ